MSATRTLLLNASFEPLRVISWQRAICLMTLGKVEVVETYDAEVRSVSFVFKVPSVVRLLRLIRRGTAGVRFSRKSIYVRDEFRCQYCGGRPASSELTYDHVVPRRLGGRTTWTNIVTACWPCNARKGGRTPGEAGLRLLRAPVRPTWLPALSFTIHLKTAPDAWREYLYWHSELVQD